MELYVKINKYVILKRKQSVSGGNLFCFDLWAVKYIELYQHSSHHLLILSPSCWDSFKNIKNLQNNTICLQETPKIKLYTEKKLENLYPFDGNDFEIGRIAARFLAQCSSACLSFIRYY